MVSIPPIKRLTQELINQVVEKSRQNRRLRQNYNFHELHENVQRFINVIQPGTYIRPHRHLRPLNINGFEFFLVLQGELGLIIMNEEGTIIHRERVGGGDIYGIELPEGTPHTLVALAPNTVILEIKEGPYDIQTDKEFLPQFPVEGTPEAKGWVKLWENSFLVES